ncbi:MAG TPA: aspartate-semialdehyde dehydrogenase [Terriglobales bacterium]|nr:aspartate-semialdehyde dehydrogenase [Terriglobales bacterium]
MNAGQGKVPVGVLGATGVVGQRFLSLLDQHPWFEPVWLAASDRSAGKTYAEATRWRLPQPMPGRFATLPVSEATPDGCPARVIFAALDAVAARQLEPAFADAGHIVVSNSSALRMQADVPLLVPEVNPEHLGLITRQPSFARGGYAVTNPNCSAAGLVMALAPLERAFGIESVFVVTMQAVSGAGYPGVASLDILGNVVPHIGGEEEKLEVEAQKILGRLGPDGIAPARFAVSAHCNRVAVVDGHLESVSVKLRARATLEDVAEALRTFRGRPQDLGLPTAPAAPVLVTSAPDRPQPRFDVDAGNGMSAVVGRLRPCNLLDFKFTVLSHNTLRGAAGAALLNAELLKAEGRL